MSWNTACGVVSCLSALVCMVAYAFALRERRRAENALERSETMLVNAERVYARVARLLNRPRSPV